MAQPPIMLSITMQVRRRERAPALVRVAIMIVFPDAVSEGVVGAVECVECVGEPGDGEHVVSV